MPFDWRLLNPLAGTPGPSTPGDTTAGRDPDGPGPYRADSLNPLAGTGTAPSPDTATPGEDSGDRTSGYGGYSPSEYPGRAAPDLDGGQGYSNFGHPTEVQDVYRDIHAGAAALLPSPTPLPQPGNPPLRYPLPDSVSPGLYPAPKRLWQWFELTMVSGAGNAQTVTLFDVPDYWWITTDATASGRIKVIQGPNDNAAVAALRLGVAGDLVIPAVDRMITIVNSTATTQQVWVKAVRGWDIQCRHQFGT